MRSLFSVFFLLCCANLTAAGLQTNVPIKLELKNFPNLEYGYYWLDEIKLSEADPGMGELRLRNAKIAGEGLSYATTSAMVQLIQLAIDEVNKKVSIPEAERFNFPDFSYLIEIGDGLQTLAKIQYASLTVNYNNGLVNEQYGYTALYPKVIHGKVLTDSSGAFLPGETTYETSKVVAFLPAQERYFGAIDHHGNVVPVYPIGIEGGSGDAATIVVLRHSEYEQISNLQDSEDIETISPEMAEIDPYRLLVLDKKRYDLALKYVVESKSASLGRAEALRFRDIRLAHLYAVERSIGLTRLSQNYNSHVAKVMRAWLKWRFTTRKPAHASAMSNRWQSLLANVWSGCGRLFGGEK